MAQTQKYEKVVILNSSLDNEIYSDNDSSSFTNRIYPISENQSYDAVFPMMTSVPLIVAPEKQSASTSLFRLNDKGKKLFSDWYTIDGSVTEITVQVVLRGWVNDLEDVLKIKFGIRIKPKLDISKHVFYSKQDLTHLFDYDVFVTHGNVSGNATSDLIIIAPNDNPMLGLLAPTREIGDHQFWLIRTNQTLNWTLKGTFEGEGSCSANIGIIKNNLTVIKRLWKTTDIETVNWSYGEIVDLLTLMNNPGKEFNFYNISFDSLQVELPKNIWQEIQFTPNAPISEISDDNQQIYVHCENIDLNRIANQNEPIFQDMFISNNAIQSGRLTDYPSIPNHIALNLNAQIVSELHFEFLNAVGEPNGYIDQEKSTIIVCKLIKKYYDFSDAKKKTYLTNIIPN